MKDTRSVSHPHSESMLFPTFLFSAIALLSCAFSGFWWNLYSLGAQSSMQSEFSHKMSSKVARSRDNVSGPTQSLYDHAVCKVGSISLLVLLCVFVSMSLQFVKTLFARLYNSFILAWRGTVNLSLSEWFKMLQVKLPPLCLLLGSLQGLDVWAQRGNGKRTPRGYTVRLGIAVFFLCQVLPTVSGAFVLRGQWGMYWHS